MVPTMRDALSFLLTKIHSVLYRRFYLHGYLQILRHFCQARLDIELSFIEAVNSSAQPKNECYHRNHKGPWVPTYRSQFRMIVVDSLTSSRNKIVSPLLNYFFLYQSFRLYSVRAFSSFSSLYVIFFEIKVYTLIQHPILKEIFLCSIAFFFNIGFHLPSACSVPMSYGKA